MPLLNISHSPHPHRLPAKLLWLCSSIFNTSIPLDPSSSPTKYRSYKSSSLEMIYTTNTYVLSLRFISLLSVSSLGNLLWPLAACNWRLFGSASSFPTHCYQFVQFPLLQKFPKPYKAGPRAAGNAA